MVQFKVMHFGDFLPPVCMMLITLHVQSYNNWIITNLFKT